MSQQKPTAKQLRMRKLPLKGTAKPVRSRYALYEQTETPVPIYHQSFTSHLGTPAILWPNVGQVRRGLRKPLWMLFDVAMGDPNHQGSGLTNPVALEMACLNPLLPTLHDANVNVILPVDEHIREFDEDGDNVMFVPEALTDVYLTMDFVASFDDEDISMIRAYFGHKMETVDQPAQALTAQEVRLLVRELYDPEYRPSGFNFVHNQEGRWEFPASWQAVFNAIRTTNKESVSKNRLPQNRIVVVGKETLDPNTPPDLRGMWGNMLNHLFQTSQNGLAFGHKYWDQRRVVVGGNGFPYTAFIGGIYSFDRAFNVDYLLSTILNFDASGHPKLKTFGFLKQSLPFAVRGFYFWDADRMGAPEPTNFNRNAARVLQQDLQLYADYLTQEYGIDGKRYLANQGQSFHPFALPDAMNFIEDLHLLSKYL